MNPELIADVYLYPTAQGGKKLPMRDTFRCPCFTEKNTKLGGWDCMILVGDPLHPGEKRRMGFVFLSGQEAVAAMNAARKFYLWEMGFVGEAVVVDGPHFKL